MKLCIGTSSHRISCCSILTGKNGQMSSWLILDWLSISSHRWTTMMVFKKTRYAVHLCIWHQRFSTLESTALKLTYGQSVQFSSNWSSEIKHGSRRKIGQKSLTWRRSSSINLPMVQSIWNPWISIRHRYTLTFWHSFSSKILKRGWLGAISSRVPLSLTIQKFTTSSFSR